MAKEKCKQPVVSNRDKACTRSAVKDGYCRQHHPDATLARDNARDMRYEQQLRSVDEGKRRQAIIYFLTNDIPTDTLAELEPNALRVMTSNCWNNIPHHRHHYQCPDCEESLFPFRKIWFPTISIQCYTRNHEKCKSRCICECHGAEAGTQGAIDKYETA